MIRRRHGDGFWLRVRVVEAQAARGIGEKSGDDFLRSTLRRRGGLEKFGDYFLRSTLFRQGY
jgi:hypothetical protein